MSKPPFIIFFIIFYCKLGLSQVAFIHNRYLHEENVILVGPLNVDKHFIGQADFYLKKLGDYQVQLTNAVSKLNEKIEKSAGEKTTNNSAYYQSLIEKTLLQLEVVELFTLDWEIHNDKFIEWVSAYTLVQNKKNCLRFDVDENLYKNSEIDIFVIDKNTKVFYSEFVIDELQMVTRMIDEELAQEKYGQVTYADNAKLDGLLEPFSINTIKLDSLATKSITTEVIEKVSHNIDALMPLLIRLESYIYDATRDFEYNPETLVCEQKVSAHATEESFYVVMSNHDLRVPSRVVDTCKD